MYENLYFTTYDALTDKATMRLTGFIGMDFTAEAFVSELNFLERNGVKSIDITINSGGGVVTEAYTIFAAIVNSKAFITTYNCGLAASCASWIFLAGNRAVMADYALLFVHNPESGDGSAKGRETVEFMRQSIVTILAKRTGNDVATIAELMNNETFLNAEQALNMGFASEIQETGILVEQVEASVENISKMFHVFNAIQVKNQTEPMNEEVEKTEEVTPEVEAQVEETPVEETPTTEEVTAEVEATEGTTEDTTEETVEEEFKVVEEVKVEEVTNFVDVTNKLAEVTNKYELAQTQIEELNKVVNELRAVEAGHQLDTQVKSATALVTNAVAKGKIEESAKESWLSLALADFTNVEKALDGMKVNKMGVDITNFLKDGKVQEEPAMNIREMEKKDPKQLAHIYNTNRTLYDKMYKDFYGVKA